MTTTLQHPTFSIESLGARTMAATVERAAGDELIYAKTRDGRLHGLRLADCFVKVDSDHIRGYVGESLDELVLGNGARIELILDATGNARSAIVAAQN